MSQPVHRAPNRTSMHVEALGYVQARTRDLADWASFGPGLLGLQRVDKSRSTIAFRMDDRKQRIIVNADGGEGIDVFGWEVADAAALDALATRLEAAGVAVARGTRALADERLVKDLIICNDPLGNRLEIFHGAEVASDPFAPGRPISGFRTGPLGLGHVVFNVESVDEMGQGYDIALGSDRVATSLGRHTSDFITSFYAFTPSGFMVEYGWGARSINPATWQAFERKEGPSMWGHDRKWLAPEAQADARKLRLANAEKGMRQPVQVMDGNYHVMEGVCPWWDSVRKRSV